MVGCEGCTIAANPYRSIDLPGGWTVNHYGGKEGFFGWLAVQPKRHCDTIRHLWPHEAAALGPNLMLLERGTYRHWASRGYTVSRVYVMYFLEGQLETPSCKTAHLHFHVVPRFDVLAGAMWDEKERTLDAYRIAKLKPYLPSFLNRHVFERTHGRAATENADYGITSGVIAAGNTS